MPQLSEANRHILQQSCASCLCTEMPMVTTETQRTLSSGIYKLTSGGHGLTNHFLNVTLLLTSSS